MPIINHTSPLPDSYKDLPVVAGKPLLVAYAASADPKTGEAWCPDVRAALPHLKATFGGIDQPELTYIEVGQRSEYKSPDNVFRTPKWNVPNVPTLARYERVDGEVKEIGRIIEGELLDKDKVEKLIA